MKKMASGFPLVALTVLWSASLWAAAITPNTTSPTFTPTDLPGCTIYSEDFYCDNQPRTDGGCAITCPATMVPVCEHAKCLKDGLGGLTPSSCTCTKP